MFCVKWLYSHQLQFFFPWSLWQESFKRVITSLYWVRQTNLWLDKAASKRFTSNWRQLSALVEISYNYLSCEFTAHDPCNNAEMNLKSTGAFLSTQNSGLVYQMEQTITVWSHQNIRDQLWRLSTLTGQVISVPFHLTKLLSPVPLFCILLTRIITKRTVAWFGSVQPECIIPLGTWNFRNFKPEFLLNRKRPATTN